MRHCGRGYGCTQHYLNYDAKVYNSSLPAGQAACRLQTAVPNLKAFNRVHSSTNTKEPKHNDMDHDLRDMTQITLRILSMSLIH